MIINKEPYTCPRCKITMDRILKPSENGRCPYCWKLERYHPKKPVIKRSNQMCQVCGSYYEFKQNKRIYCNRCKSEKVIRKFDTKK